MVRKERLELSIPSAMASKTIVYTIPPLAHFNIGTSDRNRTGTHYAADFKSAGSTYSPTLALDNF